MYPLFSCPSSYYRDLNRGGVEIGPRNGVSVDHGFPAEAALTPPAHGHGSHLCSKTVIYSIRDIQQDI
jgi:hypothetical protein